MDFIDYYWRVLATAFSQSLDTAQAIIFVIIIAAGIITYFFPGVKMTADLNGWQVSAVVLGAIVVTRLLLAPYWIWKEDRATIRSQSYAYGLALTGIQPSLDIENNENTLEIRLFLRNFSGSPIKFVMKRLDEKIEAQLVSTADRGAVIPRDVQLTFFPSGGFSRQQYDAFKDRTSGTIEYELLYGPPDGPPVRRAIKVLQLTIFIRRSAGNGSPSINWVIEKESDEPILSTP
jgi:hypothetical protein